MATIDLDAARAARAEQKPHTVRFGGDAFSVPANLPIEAVMNLSDGNVREFLEITFGDEQLARFLEHRPDMADLRLLAEKLAEQQGVNLPEASASSGSSRNSGGRSRRTSNASTT